VARGATSRAGLCGAHVRRHEGAPRRGRVPCPRDPSVPPRLTPRPGRVQGQIPRPPFPASLLTFLPARIASPLGRCSSVAVLCIPRSLPSSASTGASAEASQRPLSWSAIVAHAQARVHYFEDGNVHLRTSYSGSAEVVGEASQCLGRRRYLPVQRGSPLRPCASPRPPLSPGIENPVPHHRLCAPQDCESLALAIVQAISGGEALFLKDLEVKQTRRRFLSCACTRSIAVPQRGKPYAL